MTSAHCADWSAQQQRHLGYAYSDDRAWAEGVERFVREGLTRGQRVVYYTDRADDATPVAPALTAALRRLDGGSAVRGAVADGRLTVRGPSERPAPGRPVLDPDRQIAELRTACAEALAAGYTGLRIVREMASSAPDPTQTSRVLEYELRFGAEVCAELPVTGLCLFDRRVAGDDCVALLAAAHPACLTPSGRPSPAPEMRPPLAVTPLSDRAGLRLAGRADLDTRSVLASALGAAERIPAPVVHLDLSDTSFLDAGAVAAVVGTDRALRAGGRRLVVHRPPWSLERVAALFPQECGDLEVAT